MFGMTSDEILVVLGAVVAIIAVNGYFLFTGSDPVFGRGRRRGRSQEGER